METDAQAIRDRFGAGMARQRERLREALAAGMPRLGWKVGINVPEIQRRLDIPHAAVGWLDGRRVVDSGDSLVAVPDARLQVEPEIAIRLGRALPVGASPDDALDAIAEIQLALEIVDYARPTRGLDDLLAHCMFHEATVLGPAIPADAVVGLGRDRPRLRSGTGQAEAPRADLVPSDPAELLRFVADFLAAFDERLVEGDLVLSGSYTAKAAPIAAGEGAAADYGPLGTVSVRVVG
jgi:2-keto-4-pentenoate hydratase